MPLDLTKLGLVVIFVGIILLVMSTFSHAGTRESKVAIIGFIGPIPIGFSNDKKLLFIAGAVGLVLFLSLLFWRRSL